MRDLDDLDRSMARDIDPHRLAAVVPDLPPAVVAGMAAQDRFGRRLSDLMRRRLGLGTCGSLELAPWDRRLALKAPPALAELPRLFGSLWHGRAIRQVIVGGEVVRLVALIGTAARARALAAPLFAGAPDRRLTVDLLAKAIVDDGGRLFRVWLAGLPPALSHRLLLTLSLEWGDGRPQDPPLEAAMIAAVPSLARCLADTDSGEIVDA